MSKALVFVELDIDYCALRYGESNDAGACPAVLGVDSEAKCFNTKGTCPVRESYLGQSVTLRFAAGTGYLAESGIDAIAAIEDISFTPGTISLGEDLGTRSSLRVTLSDFPWSDTGPGFDKYLADRNYDPFRQGTFWGKFRARHPSLRGRPIRVIRGSLGETIEDMETRHYVVESVDGPGADGRYAIIAKDALKLLDRDRAQAPRISTGFLAADIAAGAATVTLSPAGIGDLEYPAEGYVAIGGKEICHFYRDTTAGADANTLLLLHFNGADAATSFPDSSGNSRNGSAVGNAQIDTAQSRFSGAALLLDGAGDYVTIADNNVWTFAGNFTVDCWVRFGDLASIRPIFSHQTNADNQYRLYAATGGALVFEVLSSGSPLITLTSAAGLVGIGGFYHVAVVRNGNDWAIYLDGEPVAAASGAVTIPNYTSTFRIGADGGAVNVMQGWIDEFRVSGVARWTAAFEVPAAPYGTSPDILTLTRAQFNTEAAAHKATDRVQLCIRYVSQDVADVIRDLMVNYAAVPAEYINIGAWKNETQFFLRTLYSALIAEPTAVETLVKELVRQAALAIWWDDINSRIRLRVLRQIATDVALFDESVIVEKSLSITDQPEKRLSQVWVYFGQVNPLKTVDDKDNYRSCAAVVNLELEDDYGSPAVDKIYSRWIPEGGRPAALRIGGILIGRYSRPPRKFRLNAFRHGPVLPAAGVGCKISSWPLQDAFGQRIEVPAQVVRIDPRSDFLVTELEEFDFTFVDDGGDPTIIFDVDTYNVNARAVFDLFYPTPEEGDDVYVIVEAGVTIGSTSILTPAMIVGDWPEGVNVHLIVRGRVQGKGGNGGTATLAGQPGGPAIYTRSPILIDNNSGEIWGGGGGGGGLVAVIIPIFGGGGSGFDPGTGASPGTRESGGAGGGSGAGAGGDPGEPGQNASGPGASAGGTAGAAIDGDSFVTYTNAGDIRGPQIN